MTVDFVVKLGGSLLSDLDKAAQFLRKVDTVPQDFIFTVGSGPLGDAYKAFDYEARTHMPYHFYVECWSAIQSINARLIASVSKSYSPCRDLGEIEECIAGGTRPVIDAKDFAPYYKQLKYQMSDVRSALVAHLSGCRRLVIFTDVEGIFTCDPRTDTSARKLRFIAANDPILRARTSVDEGLAEYLIKYDITAFVTGIDSYLKSDLAFTEYLQAHSSVITPGGEESTAWTSPR